MLLSSSWILELIIFSATLALLVYKYLTRNFDYWEKRGIYNPKPIPFFGNVYDLAVFKTTSHELIKKFYDETNEPYFGMFVFNEPILVIKSPVLIKNVMIRDFNNFCDRGIAEARHSSVISSFLFMQRGSTWKKTRSKLTPLFTSVMTKNMFSILEEISEQYVEYLKKSDVIIEAKDIGTHFATEMIARCFYGINPHCFDEEGSAFRKNVLKIMEFNFRNAVVQACYFFRQDLVEYLKLHFAPKSVLNYFLNIFEPVMEARKNYNGKPVNLVDFMNNSIEDKEDRNSLDLEVIKANAILFLIAGQETTSSAIGYALYELALHQNVQNKLREEIKINVEKYGGFTYEGIQDMKYLEMVINEILRKYSTLPYVDRTAIADYHIDGTDFLIEKGIRVCIPVFAMHRDHQSFPNPEKFHPERFSENNYNSGGLHFIPFGEGPRICIGKRIGYLSTAMAIVTTLYGFKVEPCESTPDPIQFEPKSVALLSKVGLPLKMTLISSK